MFVDTNISNSEEYYLRIKKVRESNSKSFGEIENTFSFPNFPRLPSLEKYIYSPSCLFIYIHIHCK